MAYRENGEPVTFNRIGGLWRSSGFTGLALSQLGANWTITDLKADTIESYSAQGILLSESTKTGFVRTLSYNSTGLLIAITQHAAGTNSSKDLTLTLDYDGNRRLSRLSDPLGGVTQYAYDTNSNLISVTWPDGYGRIYVYDDFRFKNALTAEIDEAGIRIATWTYDSRGRATAVTHPDSSRSVQFTYGSGSTSVKDTQRTTILNFSSIAGMLRPTGSSSSDGVTGSVWDASGQLLKDTDANGAVTEYSYDDGGRPVRAFVKNGLGTSITTIRYADTTSLHPATIASPGLMQSFVYDARNNVTGVSETETADATGASGFDALKSRSPTHAYGMAYDASNRVTLVQQYAGAQLTGQWKLTRDGTGNVFAIVVPQEIPEATEMISRDAAHRVISGYNPSSDFLLRYDPRGRIDLFYLQESASPENGGVRRILKVLFRYSPVGRVISRLGTVAKNGSMLDRNDGSDVPISSEEIDQWLDNYNFGEVPIGPPANLQGARQLLFAGISNNLGSVCSGCHFEAGLPDGILRGIALVWRLSKNPVVQYGIGQGRHKVSGAIQRLKEMCKPAVKDTIEVDWGKNDNQIHHTFRHLDELNIPRAPVMKAIKDDLAENAATLPMRDGSTRTVVVDGKPIDYVAFKMSDDVFRVGSIRPPRL